VVAERLVVLCSQPAPPSRPASNSLLIIAPSAELLLEAG
jgi:hypothetical protein